jgi:hypothetical protein
MPNPEHVQILKNDVRRWNQWRQRKPDIVPDLSEALLSRLYLSGANLGGANLKGAKVSRTYLSRAHLSEADLSAADLSGADFSAADLSSANVRGANLSRSFLGGANLSAADFSAADLSRANLNGANLHRACLHRADLSGANLSGANLTGADLTAANLYEANLAAAFVGATVFSANHLSHALGTDTIHHFGPSTIGIDTICRSGGNMPDSFLRGMGIPERLFQSIRSLAKEAYECCSCTVSYSRKDREFAERLFTGLQKNGVRCWLAPMPAAGFEEILWQTGEAVKIQDTLVLILSEFSIGSEWVSDEIRRARKRELATGIQKLFPITLIPHLEISGRERFGAETLTDMAVSLRSGPIPDFSNWRNYFSYTKALDRLIKSLRSPESMSASGSMPAAAK